MHKEVVALRSAYLKIEQKALMDELNSASYWRYLNENLLKLIKILMPQVFSKNTEESILESKINSLKDKVSKIPSKKSDGINRKKLKIITSLDNISCEYKKSKKTNPSKYIDKLDDLISIFEKKSQRQQHVLDQVNGRYKENSKTHIENLELKTKKAKININNIEASQGDSVKDSNKLIKTLKSQNGNLHDQIESLKTEVFKLNQKSYKEEKGGDSESPHAVEIYDVSEELIESNEKEIDRLREVIADQRVSITDMEETIQSIESHNTNDENIDDIEALKRHIEESSTCISMLEGELEELKSSADKLKLCAKDPNISVIELEELNNRVVTISTELQDSLKNNRHHELLLEFATEAVSAESVEDVSLLIYDSINRLGFSPNLMINVGEKTIEISSNNSVPTKDKVLINNMGVNEVSPNRKGQLLFKFSAVSGVLRPSGDIDDVEKTHEILVKLMRLSDKVLVRLSLSTKVKLIERNYNDCTNDIKKSSFEIDQMLDKHSIKTKKLIASAMRQTQSMARAKGFTASQIAALNKIEQETFHQYDADDTVRLKLRKHFLTIINNIESRG